MNGNEGALFLCNCNDDSSHIDPDYHAYYCDYKKWCKEHVKQGTEEQPKDGTMTEEQEVTQAILMSRAVRLERAAKTASDCRVTQIDLGNMRIGKYDTNN